ncbi:hypothetical protein, partial [Bifidobacterium crudilactis]
MIQSTAAIYDDGSATLTVNGQRRKIREQDAQAARAMILSILVRDAATLKEDHALNVIEANGQHHFVIHPDGSLTDTQQAGQIGNPSNLTTLSSAYVDSDTEHVAAPHPRPGEEKQPINEATTQQLEPMTERPDGPTPPAVKAKVIHLPPINRTLIVKTGAAMAVVLVLTVATICGLHAWHSSQHQQAIQSCQAALTGQEAAIKALSESHEHAAEFKDLHADQLADPSALDDLTKGLATRRSPITGTCAPSLSTETLDSRTKRVSENNAQLKADAHTLDMAVKAVVASRDAKSLADAKGGLEQAVKDAQGTFDSSDGKVADTATRDRLREALDAANKVLADESVKDPKRYQDAQASLADPVNQVNESVNAKASADQAAAAAAAQAQAQAPAQSQPRQRSSSGSGSGSSTPRRSSGSTGSGSSNHGSTGSGTTPNTG